MEVFAVTIFVSLMFGILFAVMFVAERSQRRGRSLEQEALLPLDDAGIILQPVTSDRRTCGGHCQGRCKSQAPQS